MIVYIVPFFISDIMFSGISNHQPEANRLISLADDFSVRNIFNFDGLSKLIEDLSTFQWDCLTNLITSKSPDIMKLIELGSGTLPNEDSKYLVIIGVTRDPIGLIIAPGGIILSW